MTRRVLIGTGAAVVGAAGLLVAGEATGRLDDVADTLGIEPKPLPDPSDTRVLRRAAASTADLLVAVEATAAAHTTIALGPVADIVRQQLAALGGRPAGGSTPPAGTAPADVDAAVTALAESFVVSGRARATDAGAAGSAALVRVLASMSAGHAQSARVVRGLR